MDMILVGDSLGMTMLGYDSTLPVTMDDMIRHSAAVRRGAPNTWVVGDMPYMSYQPSNETAVRSAGRFMAEAGCDSIKLEGGAAVCDRIRAIVDAGIPAIGHLGLTPQSVSSLGGFRLQGKSAAAAKKILDDAKALEEAGAFMILLELVPDRLCKLVTEREKLPDYVARLGSGRARAASDLPRCLCPVSQVQTAHGQSVRRCRVSHSSGSGGVRKRSYRKDLPRAGELVWDDR